MGVPLLRTAQSLLTGRTIKRERIKSRCHVCLKLVRNLCCPIGNHLTIITPFVCHCCIYRESLAIILCCSIGIPVILLVAVYVAVRCRRRRTALVQARNREITTRIAARDLAALIFLTSPRPKG